TTVADVVNKASWSLSANGEKKDDINAGDGVNFVDGRGTTVNVVNTGNVNTIRIDTPMSYTDSADVTMKGNQVMNPTNSVTLVGANSTAPVRLSNVDSGVGSDLKGDAFLNALTNAKGDQLNNAVNVGDLKNLNEAIINSSNNAGFNLAGSESEGGKFVPSDSADKRIGQNDTMKLDAGKNIQITQIDNGFSVATADNLNVSSVTAKDDKGSTTVNGGGITITPPQGGSGGPVSLTTGGLDNGGNKIINVADGAITAGSKDAVNGGQLYALEQSIATNITKAGWVVSANNKGADADSANSTVVFDKGVNFNNGQGTTVRLDKDKARQGVLDITVDSPMAYVNEAKDGKADTSNPSNVVQLVGTGGYNNASTPVAIRNVSSGLDDAAKALGLTPDGANRTHVLKEAMKGALDAGNGNATLVHIQAGNTGVNVRDLGAVMKYVDDSVENVKNADGGFKLTTSEDGGKVTNASESLVRKGDTLNVVAGKNVHITQNDKGFTVATDSNLKADSLTITNGDGDSSVSLSATGLNNGGNTITNVADGVNGTDAVNVNQLNQLGKRVNEITDNADAGVAAAMAAAGLPQAYLPGKSMVAVAGSTYRGKQGYAVGFSAITDGGNWIIKGTVSGHSKGKFGATVGAGYQW
ncbi:MAG: YadA-like family protein, partial [Conchiformibius sp.]|nr:YadA-like family protein [Conchiformibius sp.]